MRRAVAGHLTLLIMVCCKGKLNVVMQDVSIQTADAFHLLFLSLELVTCQLT